MVVLGESLAKPAPKINISNLKFKKLASRQFSEEQPQSENNDDKYSMTRNSRKSNNSRIEERPMPEKREEVFKDPETDLEYINKLNNEVERKFSQDTAPVVHRSASKKESMQSQARSHDNAVINANDLVIHQLDHSQHSAVPVEFNNDYAHSQIKEGNTENYDSLQNKIKNDIMSQYNSAQRPAPPVDLTHAASDYKSPVDFTHAASD